MDPGTWIAIISAVAGAAAAESSAEAQSSADNARAQAAQTNATIAQNNARNAQMVSNANEEAQRRKSAAQLGEQRAGLLQAGIGADGSAADVIAQSAGNAELDALNIRYQGQLQANNYLNQGQGDLAQANADRISASNDETAGAYGVATNLLGGASGVIKANTKPTTKPGGTDIS